MNIQSIPTAASAPPPTPEPRVADQSPSASGQFATKPPAAPVTAFDATARMEAETRREPARQEEIRQALQDVRVALAPVAQNLQFSIDDETGKTVIRVVDSTTNELIKQIPSDEFLAMAKSLDRLQGLLIQQEV